MQVSNLKASGNTVSTLLYVTVVALIGLVHAELTSLSMSPTLSEPGGLKASQVNLPPTFS